MVGMKSAFLMWTAKNKFRFNRGYSYFALVGVPFLVADALQKRLQAYDIGIRIWWLVLLAAIIVWIAGYVEDKVGILSAESEYSFQRNPAWTGRHKK